MDILCTGECVGRVETACDFHESLGRHCSSRRVASYTNSDIDTDDTDIDIDIYTGGFRRFGGQVAGCMARTRLAVPAAGPGRVFRVDTGGRAQCSIVVER